MAVACGIVMTGELIAIQLFLLNVYVAYVCPQDLAITPEARPLARPGISLPELDASGFDWTQPALLDAVGLNRTRQLLIKRAQPELDAVGMNWTC